METRLNSHNKLINQIITINKILLGVGLMIFMTGVLYGKKTSTQQNYSISGYIQFLYTYDFRAFEVPNNEFQIQRGRVRLKSSIVDNILGIVEIDCGQGELTVKDIGIEYDALSFLNFFVGQHKMPFSREELRSASKLLVIDRGEVNAIFNDYGYLGRDIGITVYGQVGKNNYPLNYALGVFNGSGYKVAGDVDNAKQFVERLVFGPVGDVSIGISSTQRSDAVIHDAMIAYGADFLFQQKGITVEGEVLTGNTEPGITMAGGNITGSYRIGPFEPAVKLERLYPDARETGDYVSVIMLNLGWYFLKKIRLQTDLMTSMAQGQASYRIIAAQLQTEF